MSDAASAAIWVGAYLGLYGSIVIVGEIVTARTVRRQKRERGE